MMHEPRSPDVGRSEHGVPIVLELRVRRRCAVILLRRDMYARLVLSVATLDQPDLR